MIKRKSLYCLCLSLLLVLCACATAAMGDGPGGVRTDTLKGVTIHTEQAVYTVGEEEICIILYNDSKTPYVFDMVYMLQILEGGTWKEVSKGDTIIWVKAAYPLMPQQTAEHNLALSIYTKKITPGQYRIVKPIRTEDGAKTYYVTALFMVTE